MRSKALLSLSTIIVVICLVGCGSDNSFELDSGVNYSYEEALSRIAELEEELYSLEEAYKNQCEEIDGIPSTFECENCGYEVDISEIRPHSDCL